MKDKIARKKSFKTISYAPKALFFLAILLMTLLSVSYVFALVTSIDQPADSSSIWELTLQKINASTDYNANCTYNVSDGTTDLIATLGGNDTQEHVATDIDISSLQEGQFDITVNCWNSSDGAFSSDTETATKDTSGVEVLQWTEPEEGWTIQNGTAMMINLTANATLGVDMSKTDVFDVSACGGSVSSADYSDQGSDGYYVNATWTVGNSVAVDCDIKANLTTTSGEIWNQSSITVTVHPDCGAEIGGDFTMQADIEECMGVGYNITANDVTLDCNGHSIIGSNSNAGINIASGVTGVTIQNCVVSNFSEGIYLESGMNSLIGNTIENTTSAVSVEGSTIGNIVITENSLKYSTTGILLSDFTVGANINITNNTITNNVNGVDAQSLASTGGVVQIGYNDIHTNSGYDFLGSSPDSDESSIALNYCEMGVGCFGNYWGVTDHCPYFRPTNTNESFDEGGFWDDVAYSTSRVGKALEESPECLICGDSIDWDEELEEDVYNRTGGDTCYGDFAVELTADDAMLDCQGYTIKGAANVVGISISNATATNVSVKNCIFTGFGGSGIGVNISGSNNQTTIYNNTFNNNQYSVYKDSSSAGYDYNITENTINNAGHTGIYLENILDFSIDNNQIYDATFNGVRLSQANGDINGNLVNNSGSAGLTLNGYTGQIEGGEYNNSGKGIHLYAVGAVNITDNTFGHNTDGIYYENQPSSNYSDQFIWHNNIVYSSNHGITQQNNLGAMEVSNGTHGNFWGNTSCPLFVAGEHSSASNIVDSHPYNMTDGWDTYSEPAPPCESVQINYYEDDYENTSVYIGRGDSIYTPYRLDLFVNITNSSAATINISHGGVCNGEPEPAVMTHDIPEDDFNFTCYVNKSVLGEGEFNFTATAQIDSAPSVTEEQNFTIYSDYTRPNIIFTWRNVTDFQSQQPEKIPEPHDLLGNTDYFYSPVDNMIYVSLNATDDNQIDYVEAYFNGSEMNNNSDNHCEGYFNLTLNGTTGLWEMNCSLGNFDEENLDPDGNDSAIMSADLEITAYDMYGNENNLYNLSYDEVCADSEACTCDPEWGMGMQDCGPAFTPILIHDMGVPESYYPCEQFGAGTTNFNTELDFTSIDFTVEIELNLSCEEGDPTLPTDFLKVYKINFTGLDFEDQNTVDKLSSLEEAMTVDIPSTGEFGDARIYINSTYFEELNTTATVGLYRLPFQAQPEVQGDPDAAGGISVIDWSTGYDSVLMQTVGNLTFSVNGFSGYNATDTANPEITIITPTPNQTTVQGPEVNINFTVNGTGTQVSWVQIYLDGTGYSYHPNSSLYEVTCNETAPGSDLFLCNLTATVGDVPAPHTLNITAYDYGGNDAPGNYNTTIWSFTSDSTPPSVVGGQVNETLVTSSDPILLNVTVTDTTNVSAVYAGENQVPMGNHTATGYNLTTTAGALGCGQGACNINFNATDGFGNENSTEYASPTLEVDDLAPAPGAAVLNVSTNVTNLTPVRITINATDIGAAGTTNVTVYNNSLVQMVDQSSDIWQADTTGSALGCAEGVCVLTFNATDSLGNSNTSVTTSLGIDETAPSVTSITRNATEVKSTDQVLFNITASDPSGVASVTANGQGAAYSPSWQSWISSGVASAGFSCPAGTNCTITINATDVPGNYNDTESTWIIVDDTAPAVTFVYNSTNLTNSTNPITLNISVVEANTISAVTVYGQTMTSPSSDGNYTITDTPANLGCSEGTCNLIFAVSDLAGNINNTATATITVDDTAPSVSGASVNVTKAKIGDDVRVRVTVTDSPAGVASVSVNGTAMTDMGGGLWEVNDSGTNFGCPANSLCTLTFTATDAVGNVNDTVSTTYTTDDLIQTVPNDFTASVSSSGATVSSSSFTESVICTVNYGTNESTLGTTVTGSLSSTGAVSISGLSSSTTYYYNVTQCQDEAGNVDTTERGAFNFTTSAPAPTGGGGGGGGGGTTTVTRTVEVGDLTASETSMSFFQGEGVDFTHEGDEHVLRVEGITTDSIRYTVDEGSEDRLGLGETGPLDLDGDTEADMEITLVGLTTGRADLSIRSLASNGHQQITVLPPGSVQRGPVEEAEPEPEAGTAEEQQEVETAPGQAEPDTKEAEAKPVDDMLGEEVETSRTGMWIALAVILAILAAVIIYMVVKKRKETPPTI